MIEEEGKDKQQLSLDRPGVGLFVRAADDAKEKIVLISTTSSHPCVFDHQ